MTIGCAWVRQLGKQKLVPHPRGKASTSKIAGRREPQPKSLRKPVSHHPSTPHPIPPPRPPCCRDKSSAPSGPLLPSVPSPSALPPCAPLLLPPPATSSLPLPSSVSMALMPPLWYAFSEEEKGLLRAFEYISRQLRTLFESCCRGIGSNTNPPKKLLANPCVNF